MGHQLAAGRLTEEIARHPAQNPLPQLSVAEGASDDEVGGFLLCERFELDGRAVGLEGVEISALKVMPFDGRSL